MPSRSTLDADLDQYMANRRKNKTDLVSWVSLTNAIQWGSEYSRDPKSKHLQILEHGNVSSSGMVQISIHGHGSKSEQVLPEQTIGNPNTASLDHYIYQFSYKTV
jgi:hypothetical protein